MLYFLLSTLVLTLYIDVVLSLSIDIFLFCQSLAIFKIYVTRFKSCVFHTKCILQGLRVMPVSDQFNPREFHDFTVIWSIVLSKQTGAHLGICNWPIKIFFTWRMRSGVDKIPLGKTRPMASLWSEFAPSAGINNIKNIEIFLNDGTYGIPLVCLQTVRHRLARKTIKVWKYTTIGMISLDSIIHCFTR